MSSNLKYTHTNLKLKYNVVDRLVCMIEELNQNVDRIKRFQIDDDEKFQKSMYSALKNVSDTMKIDSRDIDYHLKYDDVYGDI